LDLGHESGEKHAASWRSSSVDTGCSVIAMVGQHFPSGNACAAFSFGTSADEQVYLLYTSGATTSF
jgi:aspartokinase